MNWKKMVPGPAVGGTGDGGAGRPALRMRTPVSAADELGPSKGSTPHRSTSSRQPRTGRVAASTRSGPSLPWRRSTLARYDGKARRRWQAGTLVSRRQKYQWLEMHGCGVHGNVLSPQQHSTPSARTAAARCSSARAPRTPTAEKEDYCTLCTPDPPERRGWEQRPASSWPWLRAAWLRGDRGAVQALPRANQRSSQLVFDLSS